MKRIFTAVDVSDAARLQAADYIADLRAEYPNVRVGWEKPEKLHLTLKFLGDVDDEQLQNLIEAVEEAAKRMSDFVLRISKNGAFPSAKNARVLWLGVEDKTDGLRRLNEILEVECEKRGFTREKRNFKAHLTVARLREPHKSKELIERHLQNDFESGEFVVSEIVIYESRLQKSGSTYVVVSSFKFGFD